ncbi:MAG: hypothetical protein MJZ62_07260 [Bacteroidales bacterium]|nr:hypothetical protein [Bacteroidales bacterium]
MLASCTKEENASKGSSITSTIDSVNIVVNPWHEVTGTIITGKDTDSND